MVSSDRQRFTTGELCLLGAGFVGSHLVHRLLELNLGRVILLDNFNDYYSPLVKQRNVALLESCFPARVLDRSLIVMRGSINDVELLQMLFNKYEITHIAHLAVSIVWLSEKSLHGSL